MPRWDDDDARLVAAAIRVAKCIGCIVKETGVTKVRVELILAMLGETVQVHRGMSLCSACLIAKDVFQLG